MSCLFRSLAVFVQSVHEDELRQILCNYMEQNPKLMEDLSLQDILRVEGVEAVDYVRSMRDRSTWGGAIEIKAFCEVYRVGVVVRVGQTGKEIVFKPSGMEQATCLNAVRIEWTGNHYEPVLS